MHASRRPRLTRRRCSLGGRLAALLLPLWLCSAVAAQGTSGLLPDPMSARELNELLDRLDLSQQQAVAATTIHDRYVAEFETLRGEGIERFMEETQALREGFRFMTEPEAVEDAMRTYDRLLSRIVALDNRLFDDMQTVLTEEQLMLLPEARQARERRRYRSGLTRMATWRNPAARVDLSEPYRALDLVPSVREQTDPIVSQYERTLTSAAKRLYESANRMPTELTRKMAELGFTAEAMQDPRQRGGMWEAMRTAWSEIGVETGETMIEIAELNRRTYRRLATALPSPEARQLRDEYYRIGYAGAMPKKGKAERRFDAARSLELSAEQLLAVEDLYDRMHVDLDRVTDEMVDAIDADRESRGLAMFDFRRDDSALDRQLQRLRERRGEIRDDAVRLLDSIIGPEASGRLDQRLARDGEGGESSKVTSSGPGGGARIDLAQTETKLDLTDQLLPRPISSADVADYADRLGLGDASTPLLAALHEDYLAAYGELEEGDLGAARRAQGELWTWDGTTKHPPTDEQLAQVYQLRRRVRQAAAQLDEAFFADVDVALGEDFAPAMERVRLARRRSVSLWGIEQSGTVLALFGPGRAMARFAASDSNEDGVDISAVVLGVELSDSAAERADPLLVEYERTATAAFERAYEARLRMAETAEKLSAESMRAPQGQERGRNRFGSQFRELMQTVGRGVNESRAELAALNRASIAQITERLGSEGDAVRRAYQRLAFSSVFDDPRSADPMLSAALQLPDLTADQRTPLVEMAAEYRARYDELCDRMVEVHAESALSDDMTTGGYWQSRRDRDQRLDRIRFSRDDLNEKTRLRLRGVLREDQFARVGGDAEPEET